MIRRFGRRFAVGVAVTFCAVACPAPALALADHVGVVDTVVDAGVGVGTLRGGTMATSGARVVNNFTRRTHTLDLTPAAGGGVSAGPSQVNEKLIWALGTQDGADAGGNALHADATALVNLATGQLRATANSVRTPSSAAATASAQASFADTVFFTNAQSGYQAITLSASFDGVMRPPAGSNLADPAILALVAGSTDWGLKQACGGCQNDGALPILFAQGNRAVGDETLRASFDLAGVTSIAELYDGSYQTPAHWLAATGSTNGLDAGAGRGMAAARFSTVLMIPPGRSSLAWLGSLGLYCQGGASCDFSNTTQYAITAIPAGVTVSSASGVFLSATLPAATALPEPGSWATMLVGFGAVGWAMRRGRYSKARASA